MTACAFGSDWSRRQWPIASIDFTFYGQFVFVIPSLASSLRRLPSALPAPSAGDTSAIYDIVERHVIPAVPVGM
jgi:hypothetical protein